MVHSNALLSRWVARALENTNTKWAVLFLGLMKDFSWEHRIAQNCAKYTGIDYILLGLVKAFGTTQQEFGNLGRR